MGCHLVFVRLFLVVLELVFVVVVIGIVVFIIIFFVVVPLVVLGRRGIGRGRRGQRLLVTQSPLAAFAFPLLIGLLVVGSLPQGWIGFSLAVRLATKSPNRSSPVGRRLEMLFLLALFVDLMLCAIADPKKVFPALGAVAFFLGAPFVAGFAGAWVMVARNKLIKSLDRSVHRRSS